MRNLLIFMAVVAVFIFGWKYFGSFFGGVTGEGPMITETRPLEPISGIDVGGGAELIIERSEVSQITIEAQQNILDIIKTEVRDGILHIEKDKIMVNATIRYRVQMPDLDRLELNGGINGKVISPFEGERLIVECSGGTYLVADNLNYGTIDVDCSGGNVTELSGQANNLVVDISGGVRVEAFDLVAQKCKAEVSGGGTMKVHVLDNLDVDISGGGSVSYKGSPNVRQNISGGGSLRAVDPG